MKEKSCINKLIIPLYILLGFFSFPHLIDDFLYGIPEEFGISIRATQALSGVFITFFLIILWGLALRKRSGYIGGMIMGLFLALAGILKHLPLMIKPGPYWSGWFSEGLIIGMIMAGLTLAAVIMISLRSSNLS
jgi:hypothetical protein